MPCPQSEDCALYPMFTLSSMRQYWMTSYCESGRHGYCERFRLATIGRVIPPALLPDGRSLDMRLPE